MRESLVAAPLYRFFLADARAAARAGDVRRSLECLGLALDFAPESQRERVLIVAGGLAPPTGALPSGDPHPEAAPEHFVVELAETGTGRTPMARLAWEERIAPPGSIGPRSYSEAVQQRESPRAASEHTSRTVIRLVLALGVFAALSVGFVWREWRPGALIAAVRGDPVPRAARALERGDPLGALGMLEPLGAAAPSRAWLVRAAAHEALSDTAAAVGALRTAAVNDGEGGRWALEAGDRLAQLGKVAEAADAYLYAVTPLRTDAELERIASAEERAGHPDRARRVRRR